MNLINKNILLVGLAKTGISTLRFLNKIKANIIVHDMKKEEDLIEVLDSLKDLESVEYILGKEIKDVSNIDLVVVSPGVPLDTPLFDKIRNSNIEIIGDVELAYRYGKKPSIIGITGTNGKTTTTSLVGEIMKKINNDTYIVGNIGNPIIDTLEKATENSCLVAELSSFQLESIVEFRPNVSAILNITPDHLNRHKTMENYTSAKANIFKNQKDMDVTVLNFDDLAVRALSSNVLGRVVFFSRKEQLKNGVCLDENGNIVVVENGESKIIINKSEVSLPGNHNLENIMATVAIFASIEADMNIVADVLRVFGGVEHRQEFVGTINEVSFVNDSKATNPDSTIKAIESYRNPIVLIAGGMDKKNDFYDVIDVINESTVKAIVLIGETAEKIEAQANEKNFNGLIIKTSSMRDAVAVSKKIAKKGDTVLLSPACASWDMYPNFEARGLDFKNNVLGVNNNL